MTEGPPDRTGEASADAPADELLVETVRAADQITVTVRGEVDAHTADRLRDELDGLAGEPHVRLDLSDVGFMDSSGLRVLIASQRRLGEAGGQFEVVAASRPLIRLFEIAGVAEHLGLPSSSGADQ